MQMWGAINKIVFLILLTSRCHLMLSQCLWLFLVMFSCEHLWLCLMKFFQLLRSYLVKFSRHLWSYLGKLSLHLWLCLVTLSCQHLWSSLVALSCQHPGFCLVTLPLHLWLQTFCLFFLTVYLKHNVHDMILGVDSEKEIIFYLF